MARVTLQNVAQRGAAGGYAPLGGDGKVPTAQLPADVGSGAAGAADTLVPVAHSYGSHSGSYSASDGVQTSATYEVSFTIGGDCRNLRFLFGGQNGPFHPLTDDHRIKLSCKKIVGGTTYFVPIYWTTGERLKTIRPGTVNLAGPLPLDFTEGDTITLRIYVEVDAGKVWPRRQGGTAGTPWQYGVDLVDGGALTTTPGAYIMVPQVILGESTDAQGIPSVGAYGDSIIQPASAGGGWLTLGLGTKVPIVNVGVNTELGDRDFLDQPVWQAERRALTRWSTNAVWQYGINDLYISTGAKTAAAMKAMLLRFCALMARADVPVFATTMTPYTTSTDSWATVVNQTLKDAAVEVHRVAYNDWLRDGAPVNADGTAAAIGASGGGILRAGDSDSHPLAYSGCPASPGCVYPGYFDLADGVESVRNSGKWIAGYTGDGLHPGAGGSLPALATKVNPNVLRP